VIRCFEEQDYEDRCMLIYDDGGQYRDQTGDNGRWRIVSTATREPSLGAKRNHSIELAMQHFGDIYAILPCDDDDMFLPWHLSSSAAALRVADWSRPSVILSPRVIGEHWIFQASYTGRREDHRLQRLYHPAWAMRLSRVLEVGGYPPDQSGPEDQGLMRKLEDAGVTQADPIELGFLPSYLYCWGQNNISGRLCAQDRKGLAAWRNLKRELEPTELTEWEPPFSLHNPLVAPGIKRRPF